MATYYAMSDPHGRIDVLEQALSAVDYSNPDNRLFLLGDYIPHYDGYEGEAYFERATAALEFVKSYCDVHKGQVVALRGNHEDSMIDYIDSGMWDIPKEYLRWAMRLPQYHETPWQIFVHAGVEEDAGDEWKVATPDETYLWKFPATTGSFVKDIVAGHAAVSTLANDKNYHCVFWDGQSHYYLDGSTEWSGQMPVLAFDTELLTYSTYLATKDGIQKTGMPIAHSK